MYIITCICDDEVQQLFTGNSKEEAVKDLINFFTETNEGSHWLYLPGLGSSLKKQKKL